MGNSIAQDFNQFFRLLNEHNSNPKITFEGLSMVSKNSVEKGLEALGSLDGKIRMEELFTLLDKILKRLSKYTGGITFTDFFLYGDGYSINKGVLIDIRKLLETYMRMAKKFYIQYELSLLKDLDTRRIAQNQAKNALKYIHDDLKGLSSENKDLLKGLRTAKKLLTEDHKIAVAEYKILKENFSTELQKALDKLKEEWQRLEPIAVNSQAFKEDKLMPTLKLVGNVAAYSVGLEEKRVVIVPSNVFALEFFTYFENLAVLTVPIYSVRAPWDWSILWHELAGYKVRSLKKDTTINSIQINLSKLLNPKTIFAENASSLLARHGPDIVKNTKNNKLKHIFKDRANKFGKDYLDNLRGLFPKDDKPEVGLNFLGNHVGDFNHQFEQMLIGLSDEKKNQIKVDGWNVNWFEELFEDAWSVMAMREPFLDFFEDTLCRKGAEGDYRHPPIKIRLSVAKELLKLLNLGGEAEHQPNSTVEERAAKQILKFISLTLAASYNIDKPDAFIKRYMAAETVSREIGKSILKLSKKFIRGKAPAKDAREYSEKFITNKNQEDQEKIDAFLSSLVDPAEQEKNKTEPSYETLLDGLDYKQLLALSFFERDFFDADKIAKVFYRKTGATAYTEVHFKKSLPSTISFATTELHIEQREVQFITNSNNTYYMQKENWNTKFKNHADFKIST